VGLKRVEVKAPFILIRTERLLSLMDRLGGAKLSKPVSTLILYLLPLISGFSAYLLLQTMLSTIQSQEVREIGRQIGLSSYVLIPGLNPYLPILYGWIGIAVGVAVHEISHGIVARSKGMEVKSTGLLLLGPIPVGAFVEIDEEELKRSGVRSSVSVLSAGPSSNVLLALLSLALLLLLVSGMRPLVDGLLVVGVMDGYPAKDAGVMPKDVIVEVNGVEVRNFTTLSELVKEDGLLELKLYRPSSGFLDVKLKPKPTEKGPMMGVRLLELRSWDRLRRYEREAVLNPMINFVPPTMAYGFFPFSPPFCDFYSHPLGPSYRYLAELLYWTWFVNVNVGIFNAIPIYPLDGGKALKFALDPLKLGKRAKEAITLGLSLFFLSVILLIVFGPYILS